MSERFGNPRIQSLVADFIRVLFWKCTQLVVVVLVAVWCLFLLSNSLLTAPCYSTMLQESLDMLSCQGTYISQTHCFSNLRLHIYNSIHFGEFILERTHKMIDSSFKTLDQTCNLCCALRRPSSTSPCFQPSRQATST